MRRDRSLDLVVAASCRVLHEDRWEYQLEHHPIIVNKNLVGVLGCPLRREARKTFTGEKEVKFTEGYAPLSTCYNRHYHQQGLGYSIKVPKEILYHLQQCLTSRVDDGFYTQMATCI
jgi:hypothetical protein